MMHFCEIGHADLPPGLFSWSKVASPGAERTVVGAFEARGVVVRGRRAVLDRRDAFFVTGIEVDPPTSGPRARPRPKGADDKQGRLALTEPPIKGERT